VPPCRHPAHHERTPAAGRGALTGLPAVAPAAATPGLPFRGWFVVGATFVVLFFAYGLQFSYGVFVGGMSRELGWSRAETALPYAIYVFSYSALSAFTGRATDRHGPRRVVSVGAVLLAIGWGTSALVREPWQLSISLGFIAALGMSVAWVPCNATVARWFTRRRGTAVALASTGASLGNFLVPPLAAVLLTHYGWRLTLATLAIVSALAVNPVLSFTELKQALGMSDGNLSVHAQKLEAAGYLSCVKTFEGRVPKTEYSLTPLGRNALNAYLNHMETLINAVKKG